MRVLVTGGAGFVGGNLAESLAREGHDVTVLDNLDPYYDTGIKERAVEAATAAAESGGGAYEFVEGDVRNAALVEDLVGDAEIVYHQAAQAGVRTSVDDPQKPNEINVGGTLNLLDAARDADIERIVLASSSSVYGKPEYLPYDESHPTTPVSPYGVSKLAADQYARVYHEVYGLATVSLRYFTVYGPRMRPNMAISNFVSRCLNGRPPVVYGDGSQTRDFTYVDDVVDVNRALLRDGSADGEILNVGSADTIAIRTLAELVRDELAPGLEIEYAESREADAEHTHADVGKAAELLGYEPSTDVREGVRKFVDWYRSNREWYEPLVLDAYSNN
ncbi:SDR family oxidoreductase [Natronococcus jeotgali]|uniref:Nucleoside-diphosphate-sugar epimerase (UDP-glucose 4-epimerase) n=1 Tax=Natronococcus jeotgali DSM 18795 TaxID=1227498 RepID=L9X1R5_9EURY|nr:SDR family oxidoreductase [Natronococcus jeotgali]ELY55719.1 nucleoside-diphosphate-sugar epimerase (UDP-glucose 4-epimerase) [Natronococcus jeotgali DSM 18795]